MTPTKVIEFGLTYAVAIVAIGAAFFVVCCLFIGLVGWYRRGVTPPAAPPGE